MYILYGKLIWLTYYGVCLTFPHLNRLSLFLYSHTILFFTRFSPFIFYFFFHLRIFDFRIWQIQNDSFRPISTVFIILSFTLIPFCHFWQYINCFSQQSNKKWRKKTHTHTYTHKILTSKGEKMEPLNQNYTSRKKVFLAIFCDSNIGK